jgi:hypothetical protein
MSKSRWCLPKIPGLRFLRLADFYDQTGLNWEGLYLSVSMQVTWASISQSSCMINLFESRLPISEWRMSHSWFAMIWRHPNYLRTYFIVLEGNQLQPGKAKKSSMGYPTCNCQMATFNLLWHLIECWCRDGISFRHLIMNSSRDEFDNPRWVFRLAIFKLRLWCCCFRLWIRVHAPRN